MFRSKASSGSFACILVLTAACGGGHKQADCPEPGIHPQPDGSVEAEPAPPPIPTVGENDDIQDMLVAIARHKVCDRIAGDFTGLSASGSKRLRTGRFWIESCEEKTKGENVELEIGGRGWRWIDKKSEKLGATFAVSQYVPMKVDITMVASVDRAYAKQNHIVHLWLTPTERVSAKVTPLGKVDADAKGPWGTILGAAATAVGKDPDDKAAKKVQEKGSRKFSSKLSDGYSVALDLCTGQRYKDVGRFAEGKLPERPFPADGRVWIENERVRLYPGGLDITGPFQTKKKLMAAVELQEGKSLDARLVCDSDAAKLAAAFIEGKKLPKVKALAKEHVVNGTRKTLEASTEQCSVMLVTTLEAAAKQPVTYRYMSYEQGARTESLVSCK